MTRSRNGKLPAKLLTFSSAFYWHMGNICALKHPYPLFQISKKKKKSKNLAYKQLLYKPIEIVITKNEYFDNITFCCFDICFSLTRFMLEKWTICSSCEKEKGCLKVFFHNYERYLKLWAVIGVRWKLFKITFTEKD